MTTLRVSNASRRAALQPWSMAVLAVLVAMLVCGCQLIRLVGSAESTPASIVPGPITNVSLGIYSGRPDPSWSLTEDESAELGRLVGALPSTVGDPPHGGLGYHGFVLTTSGGPADGTLVAYRGAIADLGSGPRTYLVDVDRTVERYLLKSGRSHLTTGEVDAVETDLATATAG